ncbi:MAG: sugar ABC transporter ATP-binding protein [Actinobacteria bacterium]|nr:sugar ABC transporter ATP-binding protein [Actinomycetota bacterium]
MADPAAAATPPAPRALGVLGLSKAFGGTQALDDVSWEVAPGTVHALLGGNGSGKSVTIKILAGVYSADAGRLELGGELHDATSFTPAQARAAGLRFVHQQSSTFPELTVAENLAIGDFGATPLGRIRWRALRRQAAAVLERFEVDARPDDPMEELGPATQVMVAIARALKDEDQGGAAHILVLDEPTAALPAAEAQLLLDALSGYARAGRTILYVTHRLDEVMQIADRATVMRDGHHAATVRRGEFDHESLVELIMGRSVAALSAGPTTMVRGKPLLAAKCLGGGPVEDASFTLHEGEIVGIAGLLGSGRSTLLRMLFGLARHERGELEIEGASAALATPHAAMRRGLAYVPEDRPQEAAFADLDLTENMGMACTPSYFRGGRLRHRRERRDAAELMRAYMIKAASPTARFSSLSGGNQQKAILARWLRRKPRILLLDEPTQGVDVGARLEIWQLVGGAVAEGATALVVSSDFEELPAVCDRVLVLRGGRLVAELTGPGLDPTRLDLLTMTTEATR